MESMAIKRACVLGNGCPEGKIDCARVSKYLQENGWLVVDDHQTADLILFAACALSTDMTQSSLNVVRRLQREKKDGSQLLVWGCLTKIDPEALGQVYDGPTFGESELAILDPMIKAVVPIDSVIANSLIPKNPATQQNKQRTKLNLLKLIALKWYRYLTTSLNIYRNSDPSIFYIKTSTGCLRNCTYCPICMSRGRVRSKNLEDIMEEFRDGLKRGYKSFSLLGTDLGWQGRDRGYTLADLLRQMIEEKGDYRIAVRNVHPYILSRMLGELEPIFASNKIWYLGTAAESGSDRILRLMGRDYTVEELKHAVDTLLRVSPKLCIRTQIMVGFPTETEEDFQQSMRLIDEINFDFIEIYAFSERPRTPASKLEGKIPQNVVMDRYRRMGRRVLLLSTLRWIKKRVDVSWLIWTSMQTYR